MVGRIYLLRDPITNNVRYIGQTRQLLTDRLYQHWRDRNQKKEVNQHKANWIAKLYRENLEKPIIELVEEFDNITDEELNIREKYWMEYYWEKGYDLTNTSGKFYYRILQRNHKGNKKTIYAYSEDLKEYIYESARDAERKININYKIISGVATGTKVCTKWFFSFTPKTKQEIIKYFSNRKKNTNGIILINLEDNKEYFFKTQQLLSKELNIDYRIIHTYLKKQKIYKNKYIFKYANKY